MPPAKKDELGIGSKIAIGVGITFVGVAGGIFVSNWAWTKYLVWKAEKAAKKNQGSGTSAGAGAAANNAGLNIVQGGAPANL